jgi:hypothetical protein
MQITEFTAEEWEAGPEFELPAESQEFIVLGPIVSVCYRRDDQPDDAPNYTHKFETPAFLMGAVNGEDGACVLVVVGDQVKLDEEGYILG